MIERPRETEYAPYYARYIGTVPPIDIVEGMEEQKRRVQRLTTSVSGDREGFRYDDGKWSIREVIGHLTDAERVFGYRAFCISRGDATPLPAFDENHYVAASGSDARPLRSLIEEFSAVRDANLHLFRRLERDEWTRVGTANNNPVSVRALAFILVGHVNHHLNVLQERYGIDTAAS